MTPDVAFAKDILDLTRCADRKPSFGAYHDLLVLLWRRADLRKAELMPTKRGAGYEAQRKSVLDEVRRVVGRTGAA